MDILALQYQFRKKNGLEVPFLKLKLVMKSKSFFQALQEHWNAMASDVVSDDGGPSVALP